MRQQCTPLSNDRPAVSDTARRLRPSPPSRRPRLDQERERRPRGLHLDQNRRPDPRVTRPTSQTHQRRGTRAVESGGSCRRSAAVAVAGSSASVRARTTTIRLAPASTTVSTVVRSMPPMANHGRSPATAAARRTSSSPAAGRPGLVGVGQRRVELLGRVRGAPDQDVTPKEAPGRRGRQASCRAQAGAPREPGCGLRG